MARLTGGQIIARHLAAEGVPFVAGIPGHGNLALIDAMRECGLGPGFIQTRSEQGAVHLADGYYRVTGQPVAAVTSIGPGACNAVIGIATAFVESTAVLGLVGDTHTYMFGKGVLQEIERRQPAGNVEVFRPITKRAWQITDVRQLPQAMAGAFSAMLTGRPGPAVIALPMDIQAEAADVTLLPPASRRPLAPPYADPREVERAAALLAEAQRPVILAGGGVNTARAWAELRELAERLDAPVVTTLQGKGCFPEDHALAGWLGGSKGTDIGNRLTSRADVVLAVGTRFADETTSSYRMGTTYSIPPTKLVQVDLEPAEIGKNLPVEVGLVGDAKAVLSQLLGALGPDCREKPAYVAEVLREREDWEARLAPYRDPTRRPVTISAMIAGARAVLARDAYVVSSSGNTQAQLLQEFAFLEPGTNITSAGFSTMGFTVPAAIGAKLAAPERQVLGILGDGDFLMNLQELATAVQLGVPVVYLVANNHGWQSIGDLQSAVYGEDHVYGVEFRRPGGALYDCGLAAIAREFGCWAERVDTSAGVRDSLDRALRDSALQARPAVVEAIVNRERPWSGGDAVGWWDVPVPEYMPELRVKYESERSEEALY